MQTIFCGTTGCRSRTSPSAYEGPSAWSSACQAPSDGAKPTAPAAPASWTRSSSSRPMRTAPEGSKKRTAGVMRGLLDGEDGERPEARAVDLAVELEEEQGAVEAENGRVGV